MKSLMTPSCPEWLGELTTPPERFSSSDYVMRITLVPPWYTRTVLIKFPDRMNVGQGPLSFDNEAYLFPFALVVCFPFF